MFINLGIKKRIKFTPWDDLIMVTFNGILLGGIKTSLAKRFCFNLRALKVSNSKIVPPVLEIVENAESNMRLFPEVTLSLELGNFLRPVRNLRSKIIEWISPIEQMFIEI